VWESGNGYSPLGGEKSTKSLSSTRVFDFLMSRLSSEVSRGLSMGEKVCSFYASLPDIQSAINFSGAGNGARIKLDVSETEIAEVIKLMLLRGKIFKVEIWEEE